LIFGILLATTTTVLAAKLPEDVQEYITKTVPNTDIRFDGVVILPDNTIYLPLFPSLFSDVNTLKVKESFPANKELNQKPDILIFNNDFVLMKVLSDGEGHRTVLHQTIPPLQVRTGLLPQDMLVPSGLVLPENLKGIIGNLKVDVKSEDVIKLNTKESFEEFLADTEPVQNQALISQLKNKTLFITTNYSKNIQVLDPAQNASKYSLAQKSIPICAKAVSNGKFLLVTSFERPFLDIVSVADSRFIKQINLSTFPEEILVDSVANKAYVTSPTASTIFVIDLKTMSLIQKIKVNGYCEKLLLSEDKLFYVDKLKNDIWAIELKNDYELKNIGKFPNVSALAFAHNNLYIASRTKSRIAVVDYSTLGLISEFTTVSKPVAMQVYGNNLYVLGAQENRIQRINTEIGKAVDMIDIGTEGFSTGFNRIDNSELAVVTDVKKNKYTIIDLSKGKVLKTYTVNVPINEVIITNKVRLFD
jgi:DNA-binding beta-propeller fold protein YncE